MEKPKNSYVIAGNWKMNCLSNDGKVLADKIGKFITATKIKSEIVIFPPATLLGGIRDVLKTSILRLGGQDCSPHDKGAYTGDISAAMLRDIGCTYALVGHSERRQNYRETNEIVRNKAIKAHNNNLISIICVGELLEEREAGKHFETVAEQVLNSLPAATATPENTVLAYEPVWAIGTGKVAEKAQIAEMHTFIAKVVSDNFPKLKSGLKILYGGSVKSDNAVQILSATHVNGVLVGGASIDADEFCKIISVAEQKW